MKLTYVLVALLAAVVVAGIVYVLRPWEQSDIPSTAVTPEASPIDNTEQWPPPTPTSLASLVRPIDQVVHVTLKTTKGDIAVELDGPKAPLTVGNFVTLAEQDFYDKTVFHRVIPDFMIQGGDPLSRDPQLRARYGTGGPDYQIRDEINDRKLVRGSLAMANSGPNTNGSQFFIVVAEATPHLDGRHTNFGTVTEGMDVVDAIVNAERDQADNPLERIEITDVVVHDAPAAPAAGQKPLQYE